MGEKKRRMQAAAGDTPQLGDAPLQPQYKDQMNRLGQLLDAAFNPGLRGADRTTGFILMVFPMTEPEGFKSGDARANYIANVERADVITLLKEQIARFEGQPEITGHA